MAKTKKSIFNRLRPNEKEKALRRVKRAAENRKRDLLKAKKEAVRKNKTPDLLKDIKKVAENPDQIAFAEGITEAIQPLPEVQWLPSDISNLSMDQIAAFGQQQAQDLTERIDMLEVEISGLKESLKQLNQAANGWRTERTMIKELIQINQDQIFEYEYQLNIMDARGHESPPNRPEIFRYIISWIRNQPDEVLVNSNLGRLEVQLLGRINLLTQVDIELGNVLIAVRYQDDLLNNIYSSNEFLRNIRCEIGELNRTLRRASKKEGIESTRKSYLSEVWTQMQKFNTIQDNLRDKMVQVNQGLNTQYIQFEQMQNESLKPKSTPSQAYQATKALDELILNLSKDKK